MRFPCISTTLAFLIQFIQLDDHSMPIKMSDLGCISSISTVYIKPGLYNVFVITIDGTITLISLKYKLTQSPTESYSFYIYQFIKEQTNIIPKYCTSSLALSYQNEKDIILILTTNNGELYSYKYHFRYTFVLNSQIHHDFLSSRTSPF